MIAEQSDTKGKECLPEETAARFQKILREVGVTFRETPRHFVEGACSLQLTDEYHGWQVNGKGTDKAYCRASAYGEAMERLQNRFIFSRGDLSSGALSCLGFTCWPDEELRPVGAIREIPELWADFRSLRGTAPESEDEDFLRKILGEDETAFVPYYSVRKGQTVMLPDRVITLMAGSNGLSAGNTCPEALCQALCEIAERAAKFKAFQERKTPPEIPAALIPGQTESLKARVEARSGCRITFLDLSMGLGFPVAGLLMTDQRRQRYRIKLGAHPRMDLALERCLTELLQGFDSAKWAEDDCVMIPWTGREEAWNTAGNLTSAFRTDLSFVPDSFLAGQASWHFSPWEEAKNLSNTEACRHLIGRLMLLAPDVWIRNTGFLGVPAFRVYVPGISLIPQSFSAKLTALPRYRTWMASPEELSLEQAGELLSALEDPELPLGTRTDQMELPYSLEGLRGVLHYILGGDTEAERLLEAAGSPVEICMARALRLRHRGIPPEQAEALLCRFFGGRTSQAALAVLEAPEEALRRWRDPFCLHSVRQREEKLRREDMLRTRRERLSTLYRKLKEKMKDGMPVQDAALWMEPESARITST